MDVGDCSSIFCSQASYVRPAKHFDLFQGQNGGAREIPGPTVLELDLGAQCSDVNSSGNNDGVDDVNDAVRGGNIGGDNVGGTV